MSESSKTIDLTPYQKQTRDHFVFLLVIVVSFSLSDFFYIAVKNIFPSTLSKIQENFLGDFTYPLLISILLMIFARIFSEFIPELNLETTPTKLDLLGSILILTHPIRVYQSEEGVKVRFDIIGMFRSGEIIIFVISLLLYLFAIFGIQQILIINTKRYSTKMAYYIDLLYSDILSISATLLAMIYVGISIIESFLNRIDLSMMIKLIFYILFSVAALPTVPKIQMDTPSVQV